jgi:transcriptional regulator with XRE-family HTH domain
LGTSVAEDLHVEFPRIGGFSAANLWRIKLFYDTYAGNEKLAAIAKAMDFPPRLRFEDVDTEIHPGVTDKSLSLSERVDHLFETIREEKTGEPYTNAEVARMSLGDLTQEEVEGMRTGSILSPSVDKVVALASVFGIHPSYFLDKGKRPPIIDREVLDIFRDETATAIAHKSSDLPGHEKQMIPNIIHQFEETHAAGDQAAAP